MPCPQPTYNPWAVVDTIRRELAREGIKRRFSLADRMGDLDEYQAACELLLALGVKPVVPNYSEED